MFIGQQQAALMSGLKRVLIDRDAVALVMGPVGVGKSIAVARALDTYPTPHDAIKFGRMALSRDDILEHLISGLGGDCAGQSTPKKLAQLHELLTEREESDTRVIAVVEDAVRLGVEGLLELESLTSADSGETAGANLVLMGSPDLHDLLNTPELARLKQRVSGRYSLAPLSREELCDYLHARLNSAGGNLESLFTASALDALHDRCAGVPRVINRLASSVLSAAADADIAEIDDELINRVANGEPIESAASVRAPEPPANDQAPSVSADVETAGQAVSEAVAEKESNPSADTEHDAVLSTPAEPDEPSADVSDQTAANDASGAAAPTDDAVPEIESANIAGSEAQEEIPQLIQDTLPPFAALKLPDGEKTAVELAAELRDKTDNTQPALPVLTTASDDEAATAPSEPELPRLDEPLTPQSPPLAADTADAAGIQPRAEGDASTGADGVAAPTGDSAADAREHKPTAEEELDAAIDALAAQRDAFDIAAAAQDSNEQNQTNLTADAPQVGAPEVADEFVETAVGLETVDLSPAPDAGIAAAQHTNEALIDKPLPELSQPASPPAEAAAVAESPAPAELAETMPASSSADASSAFAELEAAVAELETASTGAVPKAPFPPAELDAGAGATPQSATSSSAELGQTENTPDLDLQATDVAIQAASALEAAVDEIDVQPIAPVLESEAAPISPDASAAGVDLRDAPATDDAALDIAALAAEAAATEEALTNALESAAPKEHPVPPAAAPEPHSMTSAATAANGELPSRGTLRTETPLRTETQDVAEQAPPAATPMEGNAIPTLESAEGAAAAPANPIAQPPAATAADGSANPVDSAFLPDTTFLKALEDPADDPLLDAADLAGMEPPSARRAAETYLEAAPSLAANPEVPQREAPEQQGEADGVANLDAPPPENTNLESEELGLELTDAATMQPANLEPAAEEAAANAIEIPEPELSLMIDAAEDGAMESELAIADESLGDGLGDSLGDSLSDSLVDSRDQESTVDEAQGAGAVPEITLDDSIREQQAATKAAADAGDSASSDKPSRQEAEQAKLKELAAQLGGATSLEEVDEVAAETLFGVEFTQLANTVTGIHASDIQSAADAELGLVDEPAPAAADALGATSAVAANTAEPAAESAPPSGAPAKAADAPPARPTAAPKAPPVDIDSSAYRRLQMVRSLNGKPPTPPPGAAEEIVLGEATPPPHPIDPAGSPERIEDQFGTSMTANLEALSAKTIQAMQEAEAEAETDVEEQPAKKRGFFSRFKRS